MKGDAKAIRVPYCTTDKILPQAFSCITEVRHAQVDTGFRIIGKAAWRNCQRLQIVHLASTVICLQTRIFLLFARRHSLQAASSLESFFHECGRRVGGVPRSSLKGRKHCTMREKRTQATQNSKKPPTQNKKPPTKKPTRPEADSLSFKVFPLYEGETSEKDKT